MTCPHCGYCPICGRSNHKSLFHPYQNGATFLEQVEKLEKENQSRMGQEQINNLAKQSTGMSQQGGITVEIFTPEDMERMKAKAFQSLEKWARESGVCQADKGMADLEEQLGLGKPMGGYIGAQGRFGAERFDQLNPKLEQSR